RDIVGKIADYYEEDLNYYYDLPQDYIGRYKRDMEQAIQVMGELVRITKANDKELHEQLNERYNELQSEYINIVG
ncbi:MAG: hypothetical protein IH946_02285, partial [Bacteroidetes bacterium]|nr:hypothetical protein [Bacteroidota bacterium]